MTIDVETSAAPAEGEVLPEEVQTVAQDEAEATAAEKQEDSHDDDAEPKKSKGGFQRRIDELTRQREEERREKERLLSLVERLSGNGQQKPQETPQPQGTIEPKREDYDDYEAYLDARVEYRAVRALETRLQQQEAQRARETQMTDQQKAAAAWTARVAEARSKLPDFDAVTASADVAITPQMSSALMDSEKGAEVAYYLAKNPAEAARIAALSPLGQIREIGKLEDRVNAKPVKPSNAPDPIKPVGARSSGGDPLSDKLPMDQWAKNFEKEFYKNRR